MATRNNGDRYELLDGCASKKAEIEETEGKELCAAALARYHTLEDEVYTQLEAEERPAQFLLPP